MKKLAIVIALLGAVVFVGCDLGAGGGDVPAQRYVNGLTAVVTRTGEMRGQILFPSEYAQHSIPFALDDLTFVTHPDGRFRVTNVPTGEHRLRVHVKGYIPVVTPVQVSDGHELELPPLRLVEARGRVLGRLVGDKGVSAEGVEVHLAPDDGVATTDADGIFQFLGVSAGEHILLIKDQRFFAGNQHFTLSANERRNLGNIRVYRQTFADPRTARLQN
jgi:hypothetical protein